MEGALADVFPVDAGQGKETFPCPLFERRNAVRSAITVARPRVFIPVFPGTNTEYESARAFEKAGAVVDVRCVRNIAPGDIDRTIREFARAIGNAQIVMIPGGFSAGDEPDGSGKFIATVFRSPRMADAVMDLLRNRDGLMLGVCNGFQALIKLGLVPYGDIRPMRSDSPTLTFNRIGRHQSRIVRTKVVSVLSPWFSAVEAGRVTLVPISHGEGRFVCAPGEYERLLANGQIATRYVDMDGRPTMDIDFNPNGSYMAVEGITSPDGRVLGKMGHNERVARHTFRNVPGDYESGIFTSGVGYFK
jgi:phosphoribosylformylglycinamidine synthase